MPDTRRRPIHRMFTIADPAVGVDFSITPNTGAFWLIRSLRFRLVTDANVATRGPRIIVSQGSTEYFRTAASASQAAGATVTYTGFMGSSGQGASISTLVYPFPSDGIWLPQGHTLSSMISAIQAGDQISEIAGYLTEYPTTPEFGMSPQAGYDYYKEG